MLNSFTITMEWERGKQVMLVTSRKDDELSALQKDFTDGKQFKDVICSHQVTQGKQTPLKLIPPGNDKQFDADSMQALKQYILSFKPDSATQNPLYSLHTAHSAHTREALETPSPVDKSQISPAAARF